MQTLLTSFVTQLIGSINQAVISLTPILAQAEEEGRGYNIEVGFIMLCVILGMLVTCRGSKRTAEFKKPKRD